MHEKYCHLHNYKHLLIQLNRTGNLYWCWRAEVQVQILQVLQELVLTNYWSLIDFYALPKITKVTFYFKNSLLLRNSWVLHHHNLSNLVQFSISQLILSWRWSLSYRNQSIDLQSINGLISIWLGPPSWNSERQKYLLSTKSFSITTYIWC